MGYAVFTGDLPRVRLLLSLGADPDEPWGTGTPLLQLVDEPSEFFDESALQIAEALLDAGAAVNASDANGHRPIHAATRAGRSALELLVARGADPNARTLDMGYSALHCAVDFENVLGVELLLAHAADPELTNNEGQTPLDLAVRTNGASPTDELALIIDLLRHARQ